MPGESQPKSPLTTDLLKQHGYENSWWWPNLSETLHKLNSADVNAVLDNRFDPFANPKLAPGETPFQYVARKLREEECFTPRLLAALDTTTKRLGSGSI
jgi:hypothetical protein